MKLRSLAAVFFGILLLASPVIGQQLAPADRAAAEQAMKQVRPAAIRARMSFLSDGLLEGRGTGTRGYEIAARYVAAEMEAMGLAPAGVSGGWFQPVKFRSAKRDLEKSSFSVVSNGQERRLVDGTDYASDGSVTSTDETADAGVVFAGFGVTAPEHKYDDYAGIDARGKIVVTIFGGPPNFPSTERAYYSEGRVKAANAVAHGAVGMLDILSPEDMKRYPWNWIVPQIRSGSLRWLDGNGNPHDVFPQLKAGALLSRSGAEALFAGAPKSLDEAYAAAKAGQPQGFALAASAKIHTVSEQATVEAPNIVGVLRGSDPKLKDEYVVYTAHLDHLGLCPPVKGDNVCHGAFDNASGVATLLEVAHAFSTLEPRPRRSILFAVVNGEEKGLLGSDYFANHPTVPREAIVADVNIDGAPGILFASKDVVPLGVEHSSLSANVNDAAQLLGFTISPDPMPEEVFFIRSDQYSFVRQGIPAVDMFPGLQSTDPKIDGPKLVGAWLTTLYHTPQDNMSQPFDFESAAKGTRLNLLIGYEVAQQTQRPAWNPGDFFARMFAHPASTGAGK